MINRLVILGASGNAHDVLDIVGALNIRQPTWDVVGFLDDGLPAGTQVLGLEVLGPLEMANKLENCEFINCIGSDRLHRMRPKIIERLKMSDSCFATLIHPYASVSSRASIGHGVYVSFGSSIGGGATLGDHVSIAPGVIVGHDTRIDDFSIVAPGAVISGFVKVGRASYLGARSVVKQRLTIGENSLVGMGAAVTRDVAPGATVVGVPARPVEVAKDEPVLEIC